MKSLKSKLKLLLILSGVYFFLAILLQVSFILIFIPVYTYSNFGLNILDFIFNILDAGVLGVLFVIFVGIFVSVIIIVRKIDKLNSKDGTTNIEKKRPKVKLMVIRIIIILNIVFAAFWFVNVQSEIGGSPTKNDKGYSVIYKGKFVKSITEEQYIQYNKDDAKASLFIFSSIFLLFSGMMFLSLLKTSKEIE